MNSPLVLLIDDDIELFPIVERSINPLVQLDHATNLSEAKSLLKVNKYSLILLDVHIGEQNGVEFLERPETQKSISPDKVVLFTQDNDVNLQVRCHQMGVRDYLKKPVNRKLLRSILDKHLSQILRTPQDIIQEGPLLINLVTQEVFLQRDDKSENIHLTQKEFQILKTLALNIGHIHSRDSLFEKIWNSDSDALSRTVDMHISSLKKKLFPYSAMIKNKRSVGYFLTTVEALKTA